MKINKIIFIFSISIILLAGMSIIQAAENGNMTLPDTTGDDLLIEDTVDPYSAAWRIRLNPHRTTT